MKLLIDTHVLVWSAITPERLTPMVQDVLTDPDNQVLVSAACAYEINYKRQLDAELALLPDNLDLALASQGFEWLPITAHHAATAARLPRVHRDPWDRLIAGQAAVEEAIVVSADPCLGDFGVPVLW